MSINEMLLQALSAHLHGGKVEWEEEISEDTWRKFFLLAGEHHILPMIYEAVYDCPAAKRVSAPVFVQIHRSVMGQIMSQVRRTADFLALYQQLSCKNVYPLIVKGLVCRSIYPMPDHRMSNDEDLLIPWEQFESAHQAMLSAGMRLHEPDKDIQQEFEVPYINQVGTLVIELHKDLFSNQSDAYGDFNQLFEGAHDRAVEVQVDGVSLRTLGETDHLNYLIAHAFKHFLHGGFGIRQVCDILLFAKKNDDKINWDTVADACNHMKAAYFTAALFHIGKKHLCIQQGEGFSNSALAQIDIDSQELLEDLLDSGIYGVSDMNRKRSGTMTLNAVAADKQGKKAEASVMRSIFPKAKDLAGRYQYLNKYPFLLPFAWTNRIFTYYKQGKTNKDQNHAAESIQIGKERVELLRKYKVID